MYRLHYAPDNASLIVRLMLEEIGAPYETCLVDRSVNAQKSPAYLALNPMGLIRALETPNGVIFETAAILLWLADNHRIMALWPEARTRGAFMSWLFATSNGLHTDMRQLFYPHLYAGADIKGHVSLTRDRITGHLDRLNTLAEAEPAWFNQTTPTILDIYVATILRWMALYPAGRTDWFTLATWSHLRALAARIEIRPAMVAANQAEGLGPTPLTHPVYANPPVGSTI